MRTLPRLGIALAVLILGSAGLRAAAAPPPLAETQAIVLPGVERRIDHLAVDAAGKRLFVAALGNGTLEVLDVGAGKRITSIKGLKEPQGVAYLPLAHRIVVAMRGGAIAAFDEVAAGLAAGFAAWAPAAWPSPAAERLIPRATVIAATAASAMVSRNPRVICALLQVAGAVPAPTPTASGLPQSTA